MRVKEYITLTSVYNILLALDRGLPVEYRSLPVGDWVNVNHLYGSSFVSEVVVNLLMTGEFRCEKYAPLHPDGPAPDERVVISADVPIVHGNVIPVPAPRREPLLSDNKLVILVLLAALWLTAIFFSPVFIG